MATTKKSIEVTHDGKLYAVTVADDGAVSIQVDGVWAGRGRWNGGRVEDCAAVLGDDAYAAIEQALIDAQGPTA